MTEKIIEDYLTNHEVARMLGDEHIVMLRRVFSSFALKDDADTLIDISELFAYCNEELTSYEWPEPAIARVANKALELFFARSNYLEDIAV